MPPTKKCCNKVSTTRRVTGPVQKRCTTFKMAKGSTAKLKVRETVKKKTTVTARKMTVSEKRTRTTNLTVKFNKRTGGSSSSVSIPRKRSPTKKATVNNYLRITGIMNGARNSMF